MTNYDIEIANILEKEKNFSLADTTSITKSNQRLKLFCSNCNDHYEPIFRKFARFGQRCCRKPKIRTNEEARIELEQVLGSNYQVVGDFTGTHSKIAVLHKVCGKEFSSIYKNLTAKKAHCSHCAPNRKKTMDELKTQISLIDNSYIILDDDLVNVDTPVRFQHSFCQHEFKMRPNDFTSSNQRCPLCNQASSGEKAIYSFLKERNIPFKFQFSHPLLKRRFFDFFIGTDENFFLLELDGKFHFMKSGFKDADYQFAKRKELDSEKENFCINSNIKLIRIKTYKNDIDDVLNELSLHVQRLL